MSEITSRPYQPKMACERCCFGRGEHAEFCEWRVRFVEGDSMRSYSFDPEKWRDPNAPNGTVYFLSPRRYIAPGVLEPEEEWAKRCAVITNVKVPR